MVRYTFVKRRVLRYTLVLLCIWLFVSYQRRRATSLSSSVHPISLLLRRGEAIHRARQQAQPKTLEEEYAKYIARHKRRPPKGYDDWFRTARSLKACRIDGFEDLYQSLAVYWALSGAEIRRLGTPGGMGRVRVRGGKVVGIDELEQKNSLGFDARKAFHEMLEATTEEFDVALPDLDMFINSYDEPRMSLPFELRDRLEKLAAANKVHAPINESLTMMLDLDGTAYSGRFRRFMKSRGAVVKAHLFREGIEDSLIPWYHYIPIGVRLTELYSVLGYFFVGWRKTKEAERGFSRDDELRQIAQRGTVWASQCARREDLMLHAWLIALEWGRLTSDDRSRQDLVM
ncbi:BQ2448_723 [Microbotryum intermedium]|uniref:BQ2448_723 protein n=1 Tax=Microbotryum intermedium TaxID=269621 RepID=A0A238F370_9BASI|nr:BQ2448_723 [Microbotryum intermedium]